MPTETIDVTPVAEDSPLKLAVATLDQSRAAACLQAFAPFLAQAAEWKKKTEAIVITDASQVKEMKFARDSRLALKDIRCTVENNRKRLKAACLEEGRAIDAAAKIVFEAVEPLEAHLLTQERFIELQEVGRKTALKAKREAELHAYGMDTSAFDLAEMLEPVYEIILTQSKAAHQARLEAAAKAESERQAKEKADAEMRLENERLRKEAQAREAAMQAERDKAAQEARIAAEQARKEREAIEAKAKQEREAAEAAARKERQAREAAEAEIRRAKAAEELRIKQEQEAARKAQLAPDRDKILAFCQTLRELTFPKLGCDPKNLVSQSVDQALNDLIELLEAEANNL